MVDHCGAAQDFLFFADGKPWRTCRPGKGKAAHKIMSRAGDDDVNLVQKAYCDGHHEFHGLKVSSVLQADDMRHTHAESLRRHDTFVLHTSKIIEMIAQLRIGSDQRAPKCSSDKACGRNEVNQPRHADIELATLSPENRELAIEQNDKNKRPHCAIEDQFNEQMRKFTHTDYFVKHRLLDSGSRNQIQLRTLHDLQTLFYNLCMCACNHGSQVTGTFSVNPPSVSEYLDSANKNR